MCGTKSNSKENPKEVEIPLDEPDDEPVVRIPKDKNPEYFECTEEYTIFDDPDPS